jgi:Xaa-Pro aminopeptidase
LTNANQSDSQIRKMVDARELLELRETSNPQEQVKKDLLPWAKSGNLGVVGMGCVPVSIYLSAKEMFQDRLFDASAIFEKLRIIKSSEEIGKIRQAAAVADSVYAMLCSFIRPGLSDFSVYAQVKKTIYEMGCQYSFDLIDADGGCMNMTYWPTGELLKSNSTLFMEITPAYDGYYGQLPVTLPVGEYPAGIRKMIGVWEQANQAAFKLLHPGTRVSDLYHTMIDIVRDNGYVSPLRPGHAIGLDALDFWSITPDNHIALQAGMVIAVHPCIMTKIGGEACGMGYTYLITETGAERFSQVELGISP